VRDIVTEWWRCASAAGWAQRGYLNCWTEHLF